MKSFKLLIDFAWYCIRNPELRFWQALRSWSGATNILYDQRKRNGDVLSMDTYYWNNKNY